MPPVINPGWLVASPGPAGCPATPSLRGTNPGSSGRSKQRARVWTLVYSACIALAVMGLALFSAWSAAASPLPQHSTLSGGIPSAFADLNLIDQNGRRIALDSLRGNTVLMNFIFTRCAAVCPFQTRQLVALYKALPAGRLAHIRLVSVSVDPEADTPERLREYARQQGANRGNWLFLTGSRAAISALTSRLHVWPQDPVRRTPKDHTTALYLFDRTGRMMQRYAGAAVDTQRLTQELPQLDALSEKAASL